MGIEPGECVGIVGKNGSGKTSLIKTLLRLIQSGDPARSLTESTWSIEPSILIDNYNVARVEGRVLREMIATIPQEPFLFDATIRENILVGLEQYQAYYPTVELDQFRDNLPDFDTFRIGPNGENISHGQRQLVAFLREVFKCEAARQKEMSTSRVSINGRPDPSAVHGLLILDEPTAFVDADTEDKMCALLHSLFKGQVTILIIAHKAQTINKLCHRVISLDEAV